MSCTCCIIPQYRGLWESLDVAKKAREEERKKREHNRPRKNSGVKKELPAIYMSEENRRQIEAMLRRLSHLATSNDNDG